MTKNLRSKIQYYSLAMLLSFGLFLTATEVKAQIDQECLSTQTIYASGSGISITYDMCRVMGDAAAGQGCIWIINYSLVNENANPNYTKFQIRTSSDGGITYTTFACRTDFPEQGATMTGYYSVATHCNVPEFVIDFIPGVGVAPTCNDLVIADLVTTNLVVLPIRFENINLRNLGNGHEITWNVAVGNETVNHFEIQYSANGQEYTTIGQQVSNKAARNTAYAYRDLSTRDKGFYRIKVVETNGSEYYSKILYSNNSNSTSFRIFPDPAKYQIFVEKPIHQNQSSEIAVYGVDGRQVLTGRLQGNTVDVSRLPNGNYILVVKDDAQTTYRQKFIIAK